jgi:hypothetical protein
MIALGLLHPLSSDEESILTLLPRIRNALHLKIS